jgi:hypothetical protein
MKRLHNLHEEGAAAQRITNGKTALARWVGGVEAQIGLI